MRELENKVDFKAYEKTVLEADKSLSQDTKEIQKMLLKTDVMLKRFSGYEKKSISFNDLDSFELNKWYFLDEEKKVKFRKTFSSKNELKFDTIMQKGGEFGWHFHKDCSEQCDVEIGSLHDIETMTTYNEGESVIFLPGVEHVPIALSYTSIKVTFKYIKL